MVLTWYPCNTAACIGRAITPEGECIRHAPQDKREGLIQDANVRPSFDLLSGVEVDGELLAALLTALDKDKDERTIIRNARINRTRFTEHVSLERVLFEGHAAVFSQTTFAKGASFAGSHFRSDAFFDEAVFGADALFSDIEVGGHAYFAGTQFDGDAIFDRARVAGETWLVPASSSVGTTTDTVIGRAASFQGASLRGDAYFGGAHFCGPASFDEATFGRLANFIGTAFESYAGLADTHFEGDAWFREATVAQTIAFIRAKFKGTVHFENLRAATIDLTGANFQAAQELGHFSGRQKVDLSNADFGHHIRFEVDTDRLVCRDMAFRNGGSVQTGATRIDLRGAQFLRPTVLSVPTPAEADVSVAQPSGFVESVGEADVSGLVLSGVDLSECRFLGVHNLDQLRIEGDTRMRRSPRWRARRRTLFEEHLWRAARGSERWQPNQEGSDQRDVVPMASAIEETYRLLRKGRENRGDAAGAADFYYGEMEMRRKSVTSLAERQILFLYWLVAGYGLRTSRALAWLLVLVGLSSLLTLHHGFDGPASLTESVLVTLAGSTGLSPSEQGLTGWGRLIRIVLRLLGPLLIGLALISVRGRVKRQ